MKYAYFNDEIVDETSVKFSLNERVLRLGDGFFESIKVENNKAIWAKLHYERLIHSSKLLRIKLDEEFTFGKFDKIIDILIDKNNLSQARVRCVVYRKGIGQYTPVINDAGIFFTIEEFIPKNNILDRVGIFEEMKKSISPYSEIKSSSAMLYTLASIYAKENQLDDVVILNEENRICETSKSNIFMIKTNSIFTPPLSEGCVGGVIRRVLIEHLKVKERKISYEDLMRADAVFCTNAIGEIQPVFGIERRLYDLNFTNPIIKKFAELKSKLNV